MKMRFLTLCLLGLFPVQASAHVTANPNNGESGAYLQTSFRISHGCDGKDVVGVQIQLPPEIYTARAQSKPGWDVKVTKSKLEKPVAGPHGKLMEERVDIIEWRGGPLPDSQYDDFGLLFKLPDVAQEKTLWFKTTQICKDEEIDWHEIPKTMDGWHDLKTPSPYVRVAPSAKGSSGHKH